MALFSKDRVYRIKERLLSNSRKVSLERATLMTESFKQTEGEPIIIRRAKALEYILNNMSIDIKPDELIVGSRSITPGAGVIYPECSVGWLEEELETIVQRDIEPFEISEDDKNVIKKELIPYWKGKDLKSVIEQELPESVQKARQAKVFTLNQTTHNQGHILPNAEKWLSKGIGGLLEEVEQQRKNVSPTKSNREAFEFYQAAEIALMGASNFIRRYSKMARERLKGEKDPKEAQRLKIIADVCEKVAWDIPSTFLEAVQSLWFLFLILHIESMGSSFSPGRIDQYLYRFYRTDKEAGKISDEEAIIVLEYLWLKFNEIVLIRSIQEARYFAGFPIGFNVTIGGQNEEGNDATNELSFLCLKASQELRLPQPNLTARVHCNTPEEFLREVAATIRLGFGMPQLYNDEVVVPGLLRRGIPLRDARNYAIIGCVEIGIPGKYLGLSDAALFNLGKLLELTMTDGVDRLSRERVAPPLQKSFDSFEEFEKALEQRMRFFVHQMVEGCNTVDRIHARLMPTPFLSCVIDNCVEKGLDVSRGGAVYNFTGPQAVGIANLADSLIALKKLVFEEKKLSFEELNNVLDKNFEQEEYLRQRLLNLYPKFGNDADEVDCIASKWARKYCQLVEQYENPRGGLYQPGLYSVSSHVPLGLVVGATPDGRLAREPLADGGVSPMRGRDKNGPTAVLKSVSKLPLSLATNGSLLNLKFHPSVFESDSGLEKFCQFLRGFIKLGCMHVQFNVVSADILRQAQEHPENFKDLVVRVAGYSARFVELDKSLQEDIIARTEHVG